MGCSNMCMTELNTWTLVAELFWQYMGGRDDGKSIAKTFEMENLSLNIRSKSFSRDLLQRFMGSVSERAGTRDEEDEEEEGEEGEVELNLGLSMGGRFGVDKTPKKLVRASSIASCLPVATPPPPPAYTALSRTASLPVETEEEWRKRKELQTLRRMEAKRRRSEKQRNLRSERESAGGSGSLSMEEKKEIEVNLRARLDMEKSVTALRRSLAAPGADVAIEKGKGSVGQPSSQGSVESSSTVSDLETKNLQGSSGDLSPGSIQSAAGSHDIHSSAAKARGNTSKADVDSPTKRSETTSRAQGRGAGTPSLEDMPCVFTKGDGPNGRRVDGILYKYSKGEEVRIMCICHGSFHSPAEFVKHAGGNDVENPLKYIVVNPNSSSSLM